MEQPYGTDGLWIKKWMGLYEADCQHMDAVRNTEQSWHLFDSCSKTNEAKIRIMLT